MVHTIDYTKNIYCLITGASRGIGRTIAVELGRRSSNKITLVLLARSGTGLLETKSLVESVNKNAHIFSFPVDLTNTTVAKFEQIINETFSKSSYDHAMIFHNAGQIGYIKKAIELSEPDLWRTYYDLNVFSVTALNSLFLKLVQNTVGNVTVINITSLVGRKPFKYLSLYGSGKAARDIYFKVLAEEEPQITVLNYSPGMVDTSMASELITNIKCFKDSEITAAVGDQPVDLKPEQTVQKLLSVLEKAEFKSGDIIDYYD